MEGGEWRSLVDDECDDDIINDINIRSSFFSLHESWNDSCSKSSSSLDTTPTDILHRQHQKYVLNQLKLLNPIKIQQFQVTNSGEYIDEYYQERSTHVIANFFKGRDRIEKNQKSYFNQFDIIYEGYLYKKGTRYKLWEQSWKKRYFILRRDIHCLTFYISKEDLTLVGSINISKDLKIGYDDDEDYTIYIQPPNEERYYLKGESEKDINKWKMEIRILSKSDKIPYNWWEFLFSKQTSMNSVDTSVVRMSSKSNNDHYEDYTTALYDRKTYEESIMVPSVLRDQNINNFINFEKNNTLQGFVIAAKLCHVVSENDSIFAMVKSKFLGTSNSNNNTSIHGNITNNNDTNYITCTISCTEIRIINKQVINEDAIYGTDTVPVSTIQFDLIQNFPETAIGADISIYRIEKTRDLNGKEHRKNIELCSVYISTNSLNSIDSVYSLSMRILEAPLVDLTNPIQVDSSATLGLIKVESELLYRHKVAFKRMFKIAPYSQMLYSFKTISGFTLSLEQIYASFYSVLGSIPYSDLIIKERTADLDGIIEYVLSKLAETEPYYKGLHGLFVSRGRDTRFISSELSTEENKTDLIQAINITQKLIVGIIDYKNKYISSVSGKKSLSEKAVRLALGSKNETFLREGLDNIISYDIGGSILKRSIWREEDDLNFITSNLNVHILSSVAYQYKDLVADGANIFDNIDIADVDDTDALILPFITLGCPTAHTLKFKEGGLRNILMPHKKMSKNIYFWIYLIQAVSTPNEFVSLLLKLPDEATHIFGPLDNLDNVQLVSKLLMKKMAIAERLDIVTNQILGFAVTLVKTVVSLASKTGGIYSFLLARSLKIGFLVSIESLLSTSGKELGMIEDLDIAIKWLKTITIRLVTKPDIVDNSNDDEQNSSPKMKNLDGVEIRRDCKSNRLIVDIYVEKHEAGTITSALKFMQGFSLDTNNDIEEDLLIPALEFDHNPSITYKDGESKPNIVAITQLHGVLFTQGINEMQTIVNLSFSNEVLKQVEINNECIKSLKDFHSKHIVALKYQLDKLISQVDQDDIKLETNSPNRNNNGNTTNDLFYKVLEDSKNQMQDVEHCVNKAATSPYEKHADILIKISSLCSDMGGVIGLLCKSGKDRTSMAATFEHTKGLVERLGVIQGQRINSILRTYGVRRMNVLSNIGRPYYAFSSLGQKNFLPKCYRPPSRTYKKGKS